MAYSGYRPGAAKRGRNPRWPYVPIIYRDNARNGMGSSEQVRGKAFAERAEAVAYAEKWIVANRKHFADLLADPRRGRAVREQFDVQLEEQENG